MGKGGKNSEILESNIDKTTSSLTRVKENSDKLRIRIDNSWYDLTKWQNVHPGGKEILQHLNGKDATDAFYSLHSKEAIARLKRLHTTPVDTAQVAQTSATLVNFRKLRETLESDGWFERSFHWECFYAASVYLPVLLGIYLSYFYAHTWLPIILLGLSMQQAGWIAHDYIHGRGKANFFQGRLMGSLINGFSATWWSNKHNTHHVYTNYMGIDKDIDNEPIFWLLFPEKDQDVPFRAYQHFYFVPVASFLYVSWRIQSIKHAFLSKNYYECLFISLNYLWLFCLLPLKVIIGSILLGGLLVAIIVTATHQSEEMYEKDRIVHEDEYNFVKCQFETTRDARCDNFLMEWFWGGMQYQLEHHLFPTMPKYNYAKLALIVQKFAKENSLEYKFDSVGEIFLRNFETLRKFSSKNPVYCQ